MKQKQLPKSAILFFFALSLGAFMYVNADAQLRTTSTEEAKPLIESKIENEDLCDEETRKVPIPAISVLSRFVELAQKFASVAPR